MHGRRRDKERAWENLAEVLRIHQAVTCGLMKARQETMPKENLDETWRWYNVLRTTGRLDVGQIQAILELVRGVGRTERAAWSPTAVNCAGHSAEQDAQLPAE